MDTLYYLVICMLVLQADLIYPFKRFLFAFATFLDVLLLFGFAQPTSLVYKHYLTVSTGSCVSWCSCGSLTVQAFTSDPCGALGKQALNSLKSLLSYLGQPLSLCQLLNLKLKLFSSSSVLSFFFGGEGSCYVAQASHFNVWSSGVIAASVSTSYKTLVLLFLCVCVVLSLKC